MLAREVDRRLRAPRARGRRRSAAQSSTSPIPPRSRRRSRALDPTRSINCAAWSDVDGAEDDERGADRGQRHRRRAARRRRRAGRRHRPLPVQRLRLRRPGPQRPYLEDRHARIRSAPTAARSSAARCRSRPPTRATSSSAPRGSTASAARTSSRRCCGSAASSRRCSSSATSAAARPRCVDLGDAMAQLIETDEYGIHHIVGGGECTWFDFAQEIFDQAGMETRVMAGNHADARPQGAASRLLGARPLPRLT